MQTKTYRLKTEEGLEVTFRDIRHSDASVLKEWMDSSEIAQTIASFQSQSIKMEEDWITKLYEDTERIHIGVEVERSLIGSWGVHLDGHIGKTGSMIGPKEMRGKGIAKLAHAFRVWLVFTQLDILVTKLESKVVWDQKSGTLNFPSRKSLESVGFREIGIGKGSIYRGGQLLDLAFLECYNPFFHKKEDSKDKEFRQALAKTQATLKWVDENIIRI